MYNISMPEVTEDLQDWRKGVSHFWSSPNGKHKVTESHFSLGWL